MQKLLFHLIFGFFWLITWLPLEVLYLISDFNFLLIYYVVRYRRKVVRTNLTESFPEKSLSEIKFIERRFYLHFCDYFVETMKTMHMSGDEMRRRFTFKNFEILDECYEKGQNMILYLGHYGNWEWLIFAKAATICRHPDYTCYSVYHPQSNKYVDDFFLKLRSKSGSVLVAQNSILRTIITAKKENKLGFFCFIADQGTQWKNIHYWMPEWLNHETAPITGAEKIARQTRYPAWYIDVQCPKRGYYTAEFKKICDDATQLSEYELTTEYMKLMEKTIKHDPVYWLWTHNRWKRKRKDAPEP